MHFYYYYYATLHTLIYKKVCISLLYVTTLSVLIKWMSRWCLGEGNYYPIQLCMEKVNLTNSHQQCTFPSMLYIVEDWDMKHHNLHKLRQKQYVYIHWISLKHIYGHLNKCCAEVVWTCFNFCCNDNNNPNVSTASKLPYFLLIATVFILRIQQILQKGKSTK